VTAVQVLEDFTRYFLNWINRWAEGGFEPILRQWQIRADCVGEEMELRMGDQRLRGRIVQVDELGRLIIATPEQVEHRISINEYFALDGK
jgi:biotin-(acetyl-CoA carboxylase) ligase